MRWWVDGRGACQFITYGPTRAATDVGAFADEESISKAAPLGGGFFGGKEELEPCSFLGRRGRLPYVRGRLPNGLA